MKNKKASTESKFYNDLFNHCQKQYKDIVKIEKAYVSNKQVFGIDYVSKTGNSICSGTFEADFVIHFYTKG